jgi:hypothetical protein
MTEIEDKLQENEAEIISEEVREALESVDLIYSEVEKIANNRILYGKTAAQWIHWFEIEIHPQPDPLQIQQYCALLNERLQKAYGLKSRTLNHFATYKASYEEEKAKEVSRIANRKDRKVVPAADTLALVAESQLGNRKIMHDQFQLYIDFWQNIIYKLKDQLELVKIAGMSNGTLYKAERGAY